MKSWVGFMGDSSVRKLVSYVEERGWYTADEKTALTMLAEVGMPPSVAADKLYTAIVCGVNVVANAENAVRVWRDRNATPETPSTAGMWQAANPMRETPEARVERIRRILFEQGYR